MSLDSHKGISRVASALWDGTAVKNVSDMMTSGLDAARPAWAAGLVGARYRATDSLARYVAEDTSWAVESAGFGADRATIGPIPTSQGILVQSSISAEPLGGDGTSFVIGLYPTAIPSGAEYICRFMKSDNSKGWGIASGLLADKAQIEIYHAGRGTWVAPTGATWASLSPGFGVPWLFAATLTGGNIRSSTQGAVVQVDACAMGSYVPRTAADQLCIGCSTAFGANMASCEFGFIVCWTGTATDAELRALSGAATAASWRPETPAGATIAKSINAARYLGGTDKWKESGEDWFFSTGALPPITKNYH